MPTTDFLELNKSAMFAQIRAGFCDENLSERQTTQNLLECKDDLLFAWNSNKSCLLVINWRAALTKGLANVKHQTLIPSTPLNFQVERVLASNEATYIALAGSNGINVLELPRRWGQNGDFMDGKERVTCRSTNLDARFFNNNPHLELRQVRWHPESPTDSHLLVLLSDNTLRVYDNCTLRHVWLVGPIPLKVEHSSSLPIALGDIAVDFDIAPAVKFESPNSAANSNKTANDNNLETRMSNISLQNATRTSISKSLNESLSTTKTNTKSEKVEWPIVILRENGNIYILMASLEAEKPRLQGPLTMTPQSFDNYGLDSCSLLVIPSLPLTLIIAESSGKLHHAILLETEEKEDSFNDIDASLAIYPTEWTVHVLETVELELGLTKDASNDRSGYDCPIHLKRDFINELRYFAYHNAGLHVITVNFIKELQRYLESDVISDIASLATPSSAEYIVCTKIDSGERVNAVLGFVLLETPSGIVLLLSSGQVISLKLVIDPQLFTEMHTSLANNTNSDNKIDKEMNELLQAPSFVDHIKNKLKRTVTQPILSVDKSNEPTPHECYELLTQAIEVLRPQYLERHKQVRLEFHKRVDDIQLRKEQQYRDIEQLEKDREEIREQAHRLAERFEEIRDQQELLLKKCEDLMRQANTCLPSNVLAEKEFKQEVDRISKATKNMLNALAKARESINKQNHFIYKHKLENQQRSTFELPERHEKTIQEVITQMSTEIEGRIKEVKRINKIVGV